MHGARGAPLKHVCGLESFDPQTQSRIDKRLQRKNGERQIAPLAGETVGLLDQLEDLLLHTVGLRQRSDAGLAEHLQIRKRTGGLAIISGGDAALRSLEVDALCAGHVRGGGELVDVRADYTALIGEVGDRGAYVCERGRRVGGGWSSPCPVKDWPAVVPLT